MRERLGGGGMLGALVGALVLTSVLLGVSSPAAAQLVIDPGTVIQTIDSSVWSPPSPDPSGITFRADTEQLLTCDAEVEEIPPGNPGGWQGVNVWTHSTTGVVASTTVTTAFSNEPTGVSFDPAGGRLWFSDDVKDSIFEVQFGSDGVYGTSDDTSVRFRGYALAGCDDLEDVAYNQFDGHLYLSSGGSQEICRIGVGPNGVFDGAGSYGDDVVTTFDVSGFGILDPEGIVYDPFWNTLVVADRNTRDLYELTPEVNFLRKIDVNFPGNVKPSGVTIAPGSSNPVLRNYWVTDRGADNDGDPFENDGRIFEVVAVPLGGNGAPIVDAGPPQTLEWPTNSANLDGFVSDDGHPYPPGTVTSLWSKQSGPGSVTFENPNEPVTTASLSAPGSYVLQLVGNDSQRDTTDTVAINVSENVTLSATSAGPGSVALDPPGGTYSFGQSVSVSALPEPGAGFSGWSGDLAGTTNPETLEMDADKSVTASFVTLVQLDVTTQGPGSVTLAPPGGSYLPGTQVTLTAVPGANAVFDGWGGALSGSTNPETISAAADTSVSASFTQLYDVATSAVGPGSVTLGAPGPYASGTLLTVTANPDAEAMFVGWSGDLSGAANPESLLVDADKSVTGTFAALYDVTIQATGPGSVTLDPPGGAYPAGTPVLVTAVPDPDSAFTGFGGDLSGTTSPQTLVVDADKDVTASFASLFDVGVQATGPGAVSLDPAGGTYTAGTLVSVTATPDPFAVFDGFGGDLAGTTSPQNLTVDSDKAVTASFTLPSYTLSVTQQGQGTVSLDPALGPYAAGSSVTLTAVPASPSWRFGGWSGDAQGSQTPLVLLMDGNKSVHATFSGTGGGTACGVGPELAALVPALGWLYRRRRAGR